MDKLKTIVRMMGPRTLVSPVMLLLALEVGLALKASRDGS